MQTYSKYLISYFNNNDVKRNNKLKKIIYDSKKSNYYITNSYGFIRLNCNNKKDFKKIQYIKDNYGLNEDQQLTATIANYNDNFNELNHCKCVDISKLEIKKDMFGEKVVSINGTDFKIKEVNKIKRVLGGKIAIYYSDKSDKTISIVSKNGYAFLLGCITY